MEIGNFEFGIHNILLILTFIMIVLFVLSTSGTLTTLEEESFESYNIQDQISEYEEIEKTNDISSTQEPIVVTSTQGFPAIVKNGDLVAFSSQDGDVVYYESEYGMYFDINPIPNKENTVRYVASETIVGEDCSSVKTERCTRSVYEEVNMSTGEKSRIYSDITPHVSFTRWHDVHQINETHIAVASIYQDGVYIVNTESSTNKKRWVWNASEEFSKPSDQNLDWTHLNDVDVRSNGDMILSLRNQDQVAYIERTEDGYKMNESRNLGSMGDYDTLYEQHNPDYIPEENGGPAILVGDSENNRVIEYQKTKKNTWETTFLYTDRRMQWARDADRLENGNTLITDSDGERVIQVDKNGNKIWSAEIGRPYESEILNSKEESTGPSYNKVSDGEKFISEKPSEDFLVKMKYILPRSITNAVLFATPYWITYIDLIFLAPALVSFGLWTITISYNRYNR
jgi:hypothetical protein